VNLSFLGAAGTVTGSRYLLQNRGARVLVDCGLFQGLKQLRLRNRAPLPFEPASLDAVVLTHAHLDHSGYLPVLVRDGFRGPIYCTAATHDLCSILLPDSGHLQEEEAEYANRHGYSRHHPALPLYTRQDAIRSLGSFEAVGLHEDIVAADGIEFRLHRSGHLLGSALVHLRADAVDILFTGDLGRPSDPILHPPEVVEEASHLVVESTYGNRCHPEIDPDLALAEVVNRAAARGGSVIVPSFAVGRAQLLLYLLHRLKRARRIPDLPVYLDSPMAARATDVFARHLTEHRLDRAECDAVFGGVTVVETPEQSRAIDHMSMPRVIVSASGMATGGRVLHHLKALMPDPRNVVLLVGHQAAGTRGAALVGGAREVKIHGHYVPVRAEVAVLENVSAHADREEIVAWLRGFRAAPAVTYVTHGEPVPADAMRHRIQEALGWTCHVPEHGETVTLAPARRATMV
jgi:metallo-beta-lactamase family protein